MAKDKPKPKLQGCSRTLQEDNIYVRNSTVLYEDAAREATVLCTDFVSDQEIRLECRLVRKPVVLVRRET
ncbi:hypothetical protein LB507_003243, partial [Fusarium sp. FIESC RH6]